MTHTTTHAQHEANSYNNPANRPLISAIDMMTGMLAANETRMRKVFNKQHIVLTSKTEDNPTGKRFAYINYRSGKNRIGLASININATEAQCKSIIDALTTAGLKNVKWHDGDIGTETVTEGPAIQFDILKTTNLIPAGNVLNFLLQQSFSDSE